MINFSKRWSIAAIALAIVVSMASLPLTSCDNSGGGGTETVAKPTATPPAGTYDSAQNVELKTTTEGATIYYTTNGTTPTKASTVYSSAIPISTTTTVKAFAVKEGMNDSGVLEAAYTISGGSAKTLVGISVTPPTKTVYNINDPWAPAGMVVTANYSDGTSAPVTTGYTTSTFDSSTAGNKPIIVTYNDKTAVFSVNVIDPGLPTVATPTASPSATTSSTALVVTLETTTPDADIYYTVDEITPTTESTPYLGPIPINVTTTVKAIAVKDGMNDSGVLTAEYKIGDPPVITTTSLPSPTALVGLPCSHTLRATGSPPITWTLDNSTLPEGLTLSPSGVISGKTALDGTFNFTVKASNSVGSDTKQLTFVINDHPGFEYIADFAEWLASLPSNPPPARPYNVKLSSSEFSFGGNAGTRGSLGYTLIDNNDKYVILDLSSCNIEVIEGKKTIPASAFYTTFPIITGSTGLTGITIPGNIEIIEESAFRLCNSLTSVTIPDSVTDIGSYAFSGCNKLESVDIGDGVTSIGEGAFTYCSILTMIRVKSTNPNFSTGIVAGTANYDGVLYDKNKKSLLVYPMGKLGDTFAIPTSVTSIGKMAFHSNNKITSITIPSGVERIEEQAFQYSTSLISVTFAGAATVIANDSFEGGASLPNAYAAAAATEAGSRGTYTRSGNGSSVPYTWAKQ